MSTVQLGPIRTIYLFGGGVVLIQLAQASRDMGLEVQVITAPRHASELVAGSETFQSAVHRLGLPLWVLPSLKPDISPLAEVTEDALGLSLGAAWIFREEVIRLFGGRLLNCHGSCLPEDRGGGGMSWRVLRGDRRGRCLVHLIDSGIDTGHIVYAYDFTFPDRCRIHRDFDTEQQARDLPFLIDFVTKVRKGHTFSLIVQDGATATYWPRLDSSVHGAIDWSWPATDVERFICAFDDPYPGAYTFLHGQRVHLKDCMPAYLDKSFHPFQEGLVYRINDGRVYVACRSGNISIGRIECPDRRDAMETVSQGDRLWTPADVLEQARTTRVIYTPKGRRYQTWERKDEALSIHG